MQLLSVFIHSSSQNQEKWSCEANYMTGTTTGMPGGALPYWVILGMCGQNG